MKIDGQTGLPELPEKHFWRVRPSVAGYWNVCLMQQRRFGPPVQLSHSVFHESNASKETVYDAAVFAYRRWDAQNPKGDKQALLRELAGDYPPNRL